MKTFSTYALCAALALPALAQQSFAEEENNISTLVASATEDNDDIDDDELDAAGDVAIEILTTNVNLQIEFVEVLGAIVDEDTDIEQGVEQLKTVNDKLSALLDRLDELSELESKILQEVMEDEEYLKDAKEFSDAVQEMMDLMKEENYVDSNELKAVCTEFAMICDYTL